MGSTIFNFIKTESSLIQVMSYDYTESRRYLIFIRCYRNEEFFHFEDKEQLKNFLKDTLKTLDEEE